MDEKTMAIIEMLKQSYIESYRSNIKFTDYNVHSIAGYYLTEHPKTELYRLKRDLKEGYLSNIKGYTVQQILKLILKDRSEFCVLYRK